MPQFGSIYRGAPEPWSWGIAALSILRLLLIVSATGLMVAAAGSVAKAQPASTQTGETPTGKTPADHTPAAPESLQTSTLHFGPPPSWVIPTEAPLGAPSDNSGAIQILLQDTQCSYSPEGTDCYTHGVVKALSASGLAAIGTYQTSWDPDTSAMTIHTLRILRGGEVMDVLNGGKNLVVLRRETNLERASLDGRLTATQQIEGVQVGDVLDFSSTLHWRDPALNGFNQSNLAIISPGPARLKMRVLWPEHMQIQWRTTRGLDQPKIVHADGRTELIEDMANVTSPAAPVGAPARHKYLGRLEVTQFQNWSDVGRVMAPLFDRAEMLSSSSPLRSEIGKIKSASTLPKVQAALALSLVQTQIRYQFVGLNDGGYVPATADQTWLRRYGDCKGKTALLLSLLHGLGIESEAVLVSTTQGDGLNARLPQLGYFDHVLVRAHIGDQWFWLDGTRPGDPKDLNDLSPPPFEWGLPVRSTNSDLIKIDLPPPQTPLLEVTSQVDASGGIGIPAPTHLDIVERGDEGLKSGVLFRAVSRDLAERALRAAILKLVPTVDVKTIDWDYDPTKTVFTVKVTGSTTLNWRVNRNNGRSATNLSAASIIQVGGGAKREPGPDQDAPYAAPFPYYHAYHLTVALPKGTPGFNVLGQDFDLTVAGIAFSRHVTLSDRVVQLDVSSRSTAREFPASEIEVADAFKRQLNNNPILIIAPAGISVQGK